MKPLCSAITLTILLLLSTTEADADEKRARQLMATQGCKGCHVFGGAGGTLGPGLDKIGTRMKRFQIRQKLLNPKIDKPESIMPDMMHLETEELNILVNFLASQK